MRYDAKTYLEKALPKIEELKEKGLHTYFDMSINFGSNYRSETELLKRMLEEYNYSAEFKTCKRKLTDVTIRF